MIEGINKLIASDKEELRRAPGDPLVADRRRQIGEFFTAPFRGPETGEELMKGREEFNPTERRDAAERLMNLPDARGGMELDIGTMEQPTPLKDDIYGRLPTMMPKGAMDNLEAYDKQYGAPTGTEEELKAASLLTASEPNNQPATVEKKPKPELTALEQLQQDTEKAFDPFANANANAGIASVVDSKRPTPAVNPPGYKKGELSPEGQRMLEMQEAIQAAGIKDTPEGLTGSAAIQKKLDDMGGKKGIAGLVERFANTNFKKSYGDNFGALAETGRNIAETGQKEKAQRRKFLEDQLGVQQAIEAADVAAKRDREKFDITEGRLSQKMSIDDKNTVAEIALKANTNRNAALARLAKLNLDTVNAEGAQEYRMASLALQEQANTIREKGNTTAVQKVVQGYVNSATNFYKGLLANAMTPETEAAVKQELQDEISRIVGIVGPDNVLDLKKLQRTPAGATAPDSGFSDFEKEE